MKRPAFQFYPADWRKDSALQSCSIAARGLWHELLCVMHESEPYGHLTLSGQPMPEDKIARLIGVELREYRKLLAELTDAGVPSRTQSGILFSRRMVKDETKRNVRAIGGNLGAEHGAKGADHGSKGGRPPHGKLSTRGVNNPPSDEQASTIRGVSEPPFKPPPSSSSSSVNHGVQNPTISREAETKSTHVGDKSPVKVNGKSKADREWWKSEDGIKAKGVELGIPPRRGEVSTEYKGRLFDAMKQPIL